MATESQVRKIEVKVVTGGDKTLKTIADGFSRVNRNIVNTNGVLTTFRNSFLALQGLSFAGIGIREIVQVADEMQKLSDRLNIVEGSAIGAEARLRDLTRVANENFTSIQDISTVYNRLSLALQDLGVSSQEVVTLTDRLQKTFRLSGATTAEATAATIQLSQGLASGQVRGQELRSVLEANVVIGKLLSNTLKVTRGELLKFAEKRGGISAAEFLQAVADGATSLDEAASKLRPTIREGLTRNLNDLKLRLNDLNKEFGLTEKIITGLDFVFKNLDIAAAILSIVGAYKAYTVAVKAASLATGTFLTLLSSTFTGVVVKAGVVLGGFLAPFVSLPIAITGAVTGLVLAFSTIDSFRDSVINATKSVIDFVKLSLVAPEFRDQYLAQKKAAEDLAKAQLELSRSGRSYVLAQTEIEKTIQNIAQGTETILGPIERLGKVTKSSFKESGEEIVNFETVLKDLNNQFSKQEITLSTYNTKLKELRISELNQQFRLGKIDNDAYTKSLNEIKFGKLKNPAKDFQFVLKELNARFKDRSDLSLYAEELRKIEFDKINAEAKEGRISLIELNNQLTGVKISKLNSEFAEGTINFQEFNQSINSLNIERLEESFKAGAISAQEFNNEIISIDEKFRSGSALFVGVDNYIKQAGTLSTNIANGITQTFGRLEDALVEFTTTGKFNFRDFTKAVLEDLNRIILRSLIIRPLAQGIIGALPTGGAGVTATGQTDLATGSTANLAAKGAVFNGRQANFFASGGIVSGATPFTYGSGSLGIMGEAGPEAILPLKRDGQGNLGVKAAPSNVTVNVINQSGAETEQKESTGPNGEKVIDILIVNKVKEGLSKGFFDKQFQQQYGLRRRGA